MIEIPEIIADFLKLGLLMIYAMFMMFLTFYIGFYYYGFLEAHIAGV